jgi:hypothetical protein
VDKLKVGESITVDMFFDDEITKFRLKLIGKEDISTKFGTVSTKSVPPVEYRRGAFLRKKRV